MAIRSRTPLLVASALVLAVVFGLLARRSPFEAGAERYLVLVAMTLLARALPIASLREQRHLTFAPAIVFAGTLLVGPWGAGCVAAGVCAFQGVLLLWPRRRTAAAAARHEEMLRQGLVQALAVVPVGLVFARPGAPSPGQGFDHEAVLAFSRAAGAYFLAFAVVPALWAAVRRAARPGDAATTIGGEGVTFLLGLPFVVLLVLLRGDDVVIGGIVFGLSLLAAAAAIRAGAELRVLRKQVGVMEALGQQTIDAQSEDRLLAHLLTAAQDLIVFDRAAVWMADADAETLELRATWPPPARDGEDGGPEPAVRIPWGEGLVGRVAERRRGIVLADGGDPRRIDKEVSEARPSDDRQLLALRLMRSPSVLLVPLATSSRTVGVAVFAHRRPGRYDGRDLALLQSVANLVAGAILNARLHRSLRALAVTDGLTGLTNHRRLQEILREEVWRARRYERPVSVIMCDVDFFKHYNDTFGHPQGDELLRRMARVLARSVRATDTVARYGGEEFCIVLPETDRLRAEQMAERLRRAIGKTPFPGRQPDGPMVQKTMSFGVASFPQDTDEPDQLVPLADEALYRAKRNGKNQVQTARPRPATAWRAAADVGERGRPPARPSWRRP
jgi:diguanylate cyclase (GGDEF)-like protein